MVTDRFERRQQHLGAPGVSQMTQYLAGQLAEFNLMEAYSVSLPRGILKPGNMGEFSASVAQSLATKFKPSSPRW